MQKKGDIQKLHILDLQDDTTIARAHIYIER